LEQIKTIRFPQKAGMGDGKEQVIGYMFYYNMVVKGLRGYKMVGSQCENTLRLNT